MTYLQMRGISKRFGPVQALEEVDFEVDTGEIVGLIGQNGAGKSTLLKILGGVLRPDRGAIWMAGQEVSLANPAHASRLGITVIHQEFNIIPHFTVAQNLFLGREVTHGWGRIDFDRQRAAARSLLERVGLEVDPDVPVGALTIAQKQLVEIARALGTESRIFVMDEPTAALNDVEVKRLFQVMRQLKAEGKAIVFVSHRLEEVLAISDRVTILRDGRRVGSYAASELTVDTAVRLLSGRESASLDGHRRGPTGDAPVLQVDRLFLPGLFRDVSFSVGRGEMVALIGLEGQGQREVVRTLFGLHPGYSGTVFLDGRLARLTSPHDAVAMGIGLVPEDRKMEGLCLSRPVAENIALATLGERQLVGVVRSRRESELVQGLIRRLRIVTPSPSQLVRALSGGNQQKVLIARWLAVRPRLLLFLEPTRGVDVQAKEEIYRLMADVAEQGAGILFVSSDLHEVLTLAHRILVMFEGRIVAEFPRDRATKEAITRAQWGYQAA